jgi:Lipase maturation factor
MVVGWFQAPGYWLSRFLIERALGAIYVVAFAVALNQFRPLLGERGLLPVTRFVAYVPWRRSPSIFHWWYSDRLLTAVAWVGIVVGASIVAGVPQAGPVWASMLAWFVLWVLYLSIVNVGQTFYGFGWETLLLEAGFLAIFLGPARLAPPVLLVWLYRWLLFRVEFGAGLIKIRGDPCWRDLTCLYWHHETQPMPNPLSWYFHHLPKRLHRIEAAANHLTQLVVPFGLFAPQPVASVSGVIIVVTQGWLILSGNFSWLNWITLTLAFSAISDQWLSKVLPWVHHGALGSPPGWYVLGVLAVTALIVALSYRPARNLVSRRQLMNASFDPLHLVNAYGAFGSITKERYEVVIEGTSDPEPTPSSEWREYEFKGKPGDPTRRPRQFAPYHLRLDWLMWFAAFSSPTAHPWLIVLMERLLEGDRPTLKLLRRNPFPDGPPKIVKGTYYLYRFSTRAERSASGAWWVRTYAGEFIPPLSLRSVEGVSR